MTNGNIHLVMEYSRKLTEQLELKHPMASTHYGPSQTKLLLGKAAAQFYISLRVTSTLHRYSTERLKIALNATTGQLVWNNLGFDDTATAVADGIMTSFNAYDGQIYAYGQGPSKTTVRAPDVGVTTADTYNDNRFSYWISLQAHRKKQ